MKYMLVLQFPEKIMDYESIANMESLIRALPGDVDLDGHDVGAGEVNFFVITQEPQRIFIKVMNLLDDEYRKNLKAAYRATAGEEYIIIWPRHLRKFYIK